MICSFRKSALLVEVPRGIAADRDTAVRTITPTRTASRQMMNGFVEINTFIHSALKQKFDEWMHLSPIYTRLHGEWLRYAKSTSQYSLAFSLKVRDDWGSQVNPLCRHDITRSDRQIGNCNSALLDAIEEHPPHYSIYIYIYIYIYTHTHTYIQVHLNELECRGKVNLFQ